MLALKGADASACAPPLKAEESAPLERAEALGRQLLEENACLSLRTLAVNGHDALKVGLAGPQIGQALHELLDQVAQGELPNERSPFSPPWRGIFPHKKSAHASVWADFFYGFYRRNSSYNFLQVFI